MEPQRICIACGTKVVGINPYYVDMVVPGPVGRIGPLCGPTCATAFLLWPGEKQLVAIFGDPLLGKHMMGIVRCVRQRIGEHSQTDPWWGIDKEQATPGQSPCAHSQWNKPRCPDCELIDVRWRRL